MNPFKSLKQKIPHVLPSKKPEEVEADLDDQLNANALALLKKDYNDILPDNAPLQDILRRIAEHRFSQVFQYGYSDDPSQLKPPSSVGGIQSIANICEIEDPASPDVKNSIYTTLFNDLESPYWMKANAKDGVVSQCVSLLQHPTQDNLWAYGGYVEDFDVTTQNETSVKTDTVMVYVNGSLTEDGTVAHKSTIYVMCVYYQVVSERKSTADKIRQGAYAATGNNTVKTDEDLTSILATQARNLFQTTFKFDYASTPPQYHKNPAVATLAYNDHLCYVPDDQGLQPIVDHDIFSGINISNTTVKGHASSDVVNLLQATIRNSSGRWTSANINKDYTSTDSTLAPVRANVIILCYYDHKTSANGVAVSGAYIYFIAAYYEISLVKAIVVEDLFQTMFDNIKDHIDTTVTSVQDTESLKAALLQYAKGVFQGDARFAYDGDNTKPSDAIGKVSGYARLLDFGEFPPSASNLAGVIDTQLFKRDGFEFPSPYLQQQLYDDLTKSITTWVGKSTPKEANMWHSQSTKPIYQKSPNPPDTEHFVQGQLTVVYGLGSKAEQSISIQRVFVYYLIVFYGVENPQDSEGGW